MHCKHFPGLLASEGSLEQATAELDRTYEQVRAHSPSTRPLLCRAVTRTHDAHASGAHWCHQETLGTVCAI